MPESAPSAVARVAVAMCGLLVVAALALTPVPAYSYLAGWGQNEHGELCAGFHGPPERPQPIVRLPGVVSQMVASEGNLYFLLSTGRLYACGTNEYGTSGTGRASPFETTPVPVALPPDVVEVSGHGWQAIARTADGRVWTWGSNAFGTIGNGKTTEGREVPGLVYPMPQPVEGVEGAVYVQSGGPDDIVVTAGGDVYGWGANAGGELGVKGEQTRPVRIAALSGRGVIQVVTGGFLRHGGDLYALTAAGEVLAMGRDERGQLGDGQSGNEQPVRVPLPPVRELAASVSTAYAVTRDRMLYAWGNDLHGELGAATTETCAVRAVLVPCAKRPIKLPLTHVTSVCGGQNYGAASAGGRAYVWGEDYYGTLAALGAVLRVPTAIPHLERVSRLTCGRYHVAARYASPLLPTMLRATPGVGRITLGWHSPPVLRPWKVQLRVREPGAPWGPILPAAPDERTYTISGLQPGTAYQLVLKNPEWGYRYVIARPSAAKL